MLNIILTIDLFAALLNMFLLEKLSGKVNKLGALFDVMLRYKLEGYSTEDTESFCSISSSIFLIKLLVLSHS